MAPPKNIGEITSGHKTNGESINGESKYGFSTFGDRTYGFNLKIPNFMCKLLTINGAIPNGDKIYGDNK